MNYLEEDFVNDIVKRIYSWYACCDKTVESGQKGFFAAISTYMPFCRNTGIYTNGNLSNLCKEEEILMLYPGFSWTEETIRQNTIKFLKDLQLKVKENSLNEDFK